MSLAVIIPVYNSAAMLAAAIDAIQHGTRRPDELWVVDDASQDDSGSIAAAFGARVLTMEHNVGPAACRNSAALRSTSSILVFFDADTWVHPNTIERLEAHFLADTTLSAVIGAYDDAPHEHGLISRHRNLAHCYMHRSAQHNALTFWSGCGAVTRDAFFRAGGFDERYRRPSVEDIELGYRITGRGECIRLDPSIVVKHAKRWTIGSAVTTDVRDRGIPWMVLLLELGAMPNDLNISIRNRTSTAMIGAALLCLALGVYSPLWLLGSLVLITSALLLHAAMFQFIASKGVGPPPVSWGMFLLGEVCNLIAILGGVIFSLCGTRRGERLSCVSNKASIQACKHVSLDSSRETLGSSWHSSVNRDQE